VRKEEANEQLVEARRRHAKQNKVRLAKLEVEQQHHETAEQVRQELAESKKRLESERVKRGLILSFIKAQP